MGDTNSCFYRLWKGKGREVIALRLHDKTDSGPLMDVECAAFDQQRIHRRIEPAVINDIVDMTVDVVVGPAGLNRSKDAIAVACVRLGSAAAHDAGFCQRLSIAADLERTF